MACHAGELKDASQPAYDLIVANIIAGVIIDLAPDIPGRLADGGLWIVSGIIDGRFGEVLASAEASGLSLLERRERGDWRAAVFAKLDTGRGL